MSLKRDKKEINAELNLTPFIDLLSTLVCFLLISAVWVQVSSLEIKQSHGTAGASTSKKQEFELDFKYVNDSTANVIIKKGGKRFRRYKIKEETPEALITKVDETLKKWFESKHGKTSTIAAAMVKPQQIVTYGQMVGMLDILRKNSIVNIGILPTKGAVQ